MANEPTGIVTAPLLAPMEPPAALVKAETLGIYGATGSGKTSQCERVVEWLAARLGWKRGDPPFCRVCTADSTTTPFDPWIKRGAIEALDLLGVAQDRPGDIQLAMAAVLSGFWKNPRWVPGQTKEPKLTRTPILPAPLKLFIFEGISELGDALLNEQVQQGRKISEDVVGAYQQAAPALAGAFVYSTGAAGRSHYRHIQDEILNAIKAKLTTLPYRYIIATFHEGKGKDDTTGTSTLGPKLPGQAGGGKVGQKFSHFLHIDIVHPGQGKPIEYRAYYRPHPENPAMPSSPMWTGRIGLDLTSAARWEREHSATPGYIPLVLEPWNPASGKGSVAELLQFTAGLGEEEPK